MEQVFPFPFPKTNRLLCSEITDSDPEKREELLFWQNTLDHVSEGKMSWEQFLQKLGTPISSHPAARIATTRSGQTLLHLAVLLNRHDVIQELSREIVLKTRRNSFGLTPLEIAQYLDRKESIVLLQSPGDRHFCNRSRVSIPDSEKELFSQLEYLSHPIFEKEELLHDLLKKTNKAKLEDEIPPEKIWMGVYFDKEIQRGIHPLVSIQYIDPDVGYGVFAKQRIPTCAFVGEYTGIVQERKKKHLKDKYYCVRYTVWEMGRRNFVIDAETKGNFTRFINHSSKPNLGLQSVYWRGMPRMIFVALKEIQEGTQLTFDYGAFFWKECPQTPKLFE